MKLNCRSYGHVLKATLVAIALSSGVAVAQDYSSMGITDLVGSADRMLQRGDYRAPEETRNRGEQGWPHGVKMHDIKRTDGGMRSTQRRVQGGIDVFATDRRHEHATNASNPLVALGRIPPTHVDGDVVAPRSEARRDGVDVSFNASPRSGKTLLTDKGKAQMFRHGSPEASP